MNEQSWFVPVKDALVLLLVYWIAAIVLFFICKLLFRDNAKAAIASFLLMAFHFFFGSIHDALKWKYSVILPVFLIIFIAAFIILKKHRASLMRACTYLNVLFIVLIAWEAINALLPKRSLITKQAFTICDTCGKPDIYLILLDEYAGTQSLKDLFAFDNLDFETQLNSRGFHVVRNSRSNYNYTPFSMASMLNMAYLKLENTERKKPDLSYALRYISSNQVQQMLTVNGYEFFNHSGFDLAGQPTPIEETFMPAKTKLITAQTFLSRLQRDLGYHWLLLNSDPNRAYCELHNNTKLYDLTMNLAAQPHEKPRFVYTHLMMPHYPYYFNRNGKAMDPARVLPEANNANKKDYVEYLQYANKKVLELADHILQNSRKPPVIIIMSDHGFRHFTITEPREYHFMDLNSIYLPNKNYRGFYDGMSNVNQFRVLFNTLFNSQLPLLKDSSIYLKD